MGDVRTPTKGSKNNSPLLQRLASSGSKARANWTKVSAARRFLSLALIQSRQAPAHLIIGAKYRVGKKINNGAFGQLRLGYVLNNGGDEAKEEQVAIKMEPSQTRLPMLFLEFRFYKIIGPHVGIPKVHYYGTCGKYNALVMDLLGPNLEELFQALNYTFSLKTILQIAIQLISRVELVHANGIIYRDIKPENCLVGRPGKFHIIHLVDFGLAKEYLDPETGKHIHYKENKSLTGTVRYMSVNSHQGKEQSRRDDLEALGHVFFYFLTGGRLPWQGVKSEDIKRRYQVIGQIKEETRVSVLGNRFPWEFSVYLRYCRALKFAQQPDYSYLKSLFKGCLKRLELSHDDVFDWMDPTFPLRRYDSSSETVIEIRQTQDNYLTPGHSQRRGVTKSDESVILEMSVSAKQEASVLDDDREVVEKSVQIENTDPDQGLDQVKATTTTNKTPRAAGDQGRSGDANVERVEFTSCCSFAMMTRRLAMNL